jgi:hypothetical protein
VSKLRILLTIDLLSVLRVLPPLLNALTGVALSHNWLATTMLCTILQPCLVQALPNTASPLAQFPEISPAEAQEMEIVKGLEGKRWIEKWAKRDLVQGEAKQVIEHWPRLEIVDAEFKGELWSCFRYGVVGSTPVCLDIPTNMSFLPVCVNVSLNSKPDKHSYGREDCHTRRYRPTYLPMSLRLPVYAIHQAQARCTGHHSN